MSEARSGPRTARFVSRVCMTRPFLRGLSYKDEQGMGDWCWCWQEALWTRNEMLGIEEDGDGRKRIDTGSMWVHT
jgi:hypothetical protein